MEEFRDPKAPLRLCDAHANGDTTFRPTSSLPGSPLEVLERLEVAHSTKDIAAQLFLSPKTVERHISNLAVKLGLDGRAALVAFAAARAARLDR